MVRQRTGDGIAEQRGGDCEDSFSFVRPSRGKHWQRGDNQLPPSTAIRHGRKSAFSQTAQAALHRTLRRRQTAPPFLPLHQIHATSDIKFTVKQQRQLLRCCGCCGAVLLLQAVAIVILIFTVFKVKDPVIRLNGVMVDRLDLINGTATPRPGSNMSLTADVSVKNPNFASFRYPETTSALFYHGATIGEARGPAGRARRTARMNVTVEVIEDRVLARPDLRSDINSGLLTLGRMEAAKMGRERRTIVEEKEK